MHDDDSGDNDDDDDLGATARYFLDDDPSVLQICNNSSTISRKVGAVGFANRIGKLFKREVTL